MLTVETEVCLLFIGASSIIPIAFLLSAEDSQAPGFYWDLRGVGFYWDLRGAGFLYVFTRRLARKCWAVFKRQCCGDGKGSPGENDCHSQ